MNDPQTEGHMASHIGRRKFLATLGGGAAVWPIAARAQQRERMRRIAVLSGLAADDQDNKVRLAAFQQRLQQLGWTDGHNVRIDYRFAANAENYRKYAAELVALAPDVILAPGASLAHMLQATRTVPIVFVNVADPVGAGSVESLSRPGGNATGFMTFEYNLSGKWLELLKEIAPGVTRAAVLRVTEITGIGQFAVIQSVARSVGVEVSPLNLRDADETERAVTAFARSSNGGLIVPASVLAGVQRNLIVEHLRPATGCPRSTPDGCSSLAAVWSPSELIRLNSFDMPPATSIASSRAKSQPICRCRHRPSTNW